MNKNKLTLVIDGNWLLMSRFFIDKDSFLCSQPQDVKLEAQERLVTLMSQSISVTLRKFQKLIDNIILVTDNKSWRKSLPKPETLRVDYKGNRYSSAELDMSYVFDSLKILSDKFKESNITVCNTFGAEGDDWCWYWSRKLNKEGINVILWTIDEDIEQLIQVDHNTAAFTAWYNDKKGCIFHEDIDNNYSDCIDFFMHPEYTNNTYIQITKTPIITKTVSPNNIICKKVFIGDSGDNIFPIFTINKNNKKFKATERDYLKIHNNIFSTMWNMIQNTTTEELIESKLEDIYNSLLKIKKCNNNTDHTSLEDFISHFYYNIQLVWLHESQIPGYVTEGMDEIEYIISDLNTINNINMNYKHLSRNDNTIEKLFDTLDVPF